MTVCEHPLQLDVCKAFLGLPRDAVHPFSVAAVAYEGWMRSMLWPQAANHGQVFSLRVSVDWNKKVALAYKLKRAYHRSPFPCELALRYIYIYWVAYRCCRKDSAKARVACFLQFLSECPRNMFTSTPLLEPSWE